MKEVHVFDIDGTVTGIDVLLQCLTSYVGSEVKPEHLTKYSLQDAMYENKFVTSSKLFCNKEFFNDCAKEYLMNADMKPYFMDYLNMLKREGHEVYFMTARSPEREPLTKQLFKNLGIPYENVIHTGHAVNKLDELRELGATHFYDDHPVTVLSAAEYIENVYCPKYKYNEHLEAIESIVVFDSWKDLLPYFRV